MIIFFKKKKKKIHWESAAEFDPHSSHDLLSSIILYNEFEPIDQHRHRMGCGTILAESVIAMKGLDEGSLWSMMTSSYTRVRTNVYTCALPLLTWVTLLPRGAPMDAISFNKGCTCTA